jgi:hypothetical protein
MWIYGSLICLILLITVKRVCLRIEDIFLFNIESYQKMGKANHNNPDY